MKKISFILISVLCPLILMSQTDNMEKYVFELSGRTYVKPVQDDWHFVLQNLEPPQIGNETYRGWLMEIKEEIAKRYPRKSQAFQLKTTKTIVDTPVISRNFEGNQFTGGVPNDNTLAVSDDGWVVSAINSNIMMYDLQVDSVVKTISLVAFSDTLPIVAHQYDPKLVYDQVAHRFIITYLAGNADSISNLIIGFSQTPDPTGIWNLYALPGNPYNDSSWTDYPAVALSDQELFVTVNLLKNGGPWQTSFKQTVVWQINKQDGYDGHPLTSVLWKNIETNGKPIRNLCPVGGGDTLSTSGMYFLSNRNFDIQNDTVFLVHIDSCIGCNPQLDIDILKTDKAYGVPPMARQLNDHIFDTNDGRILGAFVKNNKIQFVANTIDTTTGFAAAYHGTISDLHLAPKVTGRILSDSVLDFGYPNISYVGITDSSDQAIISFNHTAPGVFAGFSALLYDGEGSYSKRITVKDGLNIANLISGTYERWGDYTGSQRKYNQPGVVWVAGSWGKKVKIGFISYYITGTWIAELINPVIQGAPEKQIVSKDLSIKTFPNPSSDRVFVRFNLAEETDLQIKLFDINGKLVKNLFNDRAQKGKNQISFSTLPLKQGIYVLTINDRSKVFYTQKLIVD